MDEPDTPSCHLSGPPGLYIPILWTMISHCGRYCLNLLQGVWITNRTTLVHLLSQHMDHFWFQVMITLIFTPACTQLSPPCTYISIHPLWKYFLNLPQGLQVPNRTAIFHLPGHHSNHLLVSSHQQSPCSSYPPCVQLSLSCTHIHSKSSTGSVNNN